MSKLSEVLVISDRRTAFEAHTLDAKQWIKAEVTPSRIDGFWHVAVIEKGGIVRFPNRPVSPNGVDLFLSHCGVTDADFRAAPREPSHFNPWDPARPEEQTEDTRDVYFIQGVNGGPIKIGVARDPQERLASIQLMSPVRLHILGVLRATGQSEERRLHKRFAEHRLHGEWFQPTPELIEYIKENT